jgi:hypothetical protein
MAKAGPRVAQIATALMPNLSRVPRRSKVAWGKNGVRIMTGGLAESLRDDFMSGAAARLGASGAAADLICCFDHSPTLVRQRQLAIIISGNQAEVRQPRPNRPRDCGSFPS